MSKKIKVLGIITARGGSKGIPGKNIKKLGGKPLIAYTVEAAKKSGVFDRIILSTDAWEIAETGAKFGAETPFIRPAELAKDNTPTLPVLIHAVSWLREKENYFPDYAMILQPTSPFRQPFHIQEAVELIKKTGADSVLGVSEVPEKYNPARTMFLGSDGNLFLSNGNPVRKRIARRQDLPKAFYNTCALYLFKTELLFGKNPNFWGDKVAPYEMEEKYALDINDMSDWREAEKIVKNGF